MEWVNEPSSNTVEAKGDCPIKQWLCIDLCLANCDLCLIYIY